MELIVILWVLGQLSRWSRAAEAFVLHLRLLVWAWKPHTWDMGVPSPGSDIVLIAI